MLVIGNFSLDALKEIYRHNPNMVVINNKQVPDYIDAVYSDLEQAMYQLLNQIRDTYHDAHIAYYGGIREERNLDGKEAYENDARYHAYLSWCQQHDEIPNGNLIGWEREDGFEAITEADTIPDVLIAGNDMVAIGLIQGLQQRGVTIPKDAGVIGFNDLDVNQYVTPSLTSVRIDIEQFGKSAVLMAKERIQKTRQSAMHIVIQTKQIERQSFSFKNQ